MLTYIKVTQADIDRGIPNECFECPVALAIARRVSNKTRVLVEPHSVEFSPPVWKYGTEIALPEEARHFIQAFDGNLFNVLPRATIAAAMRPFGFMLDIPARYLLGGVHAPEKSPS